MFCKFISVLAGVVEEHLISNGHSFALPFRQLWQNSFRFSTVTSSAGILYFASLVRFRILTAGTLTSLIQKYSKPHLCLVSLVSTKTNVTWEQRVMHVVESSSFGLAILEKQTMELGSGLGSNLKCKGLCRTFFWSQSNNQQLCGHYHTLILVNKKC